jgi:hypothetical protein
MAKINTWAVATNNIAPLVSFLKNHDVPNTNPLHLYQVKTIGSAVEKTDITVVIPGTGRTFKIEKIDTLITDQDLLVCPVNKTMTDAPASQSLLYTLIIARSYYGWWKTNMEIPVLFDNKPRQIVFKDNVSNSSDDNYDSVLLLFNEERTNGLITGEMKMEPFPVISIHSYSEALKFISDKIKDPKVFNKLLNISCTVQTEIENLVIGIEYRNVWFEEELLEAYVIRFTDEFAGDKNFLIAFPVKDGEVVDVTELSTDDNDVDSNVEPGLKAFCITTSKLYRHINIAVFATTREKAFDILKQNHGNVVTEYSVKIEQLEERELKEGLTMSCTGEDVTDFFFCPE